MSSKVTKIQRENFVWIDVYEPTRKYLEELSREFSLEPSVVRESLKPEHLPKIEFFNERVFMVTRVYDSKCLHDADDVQELTRKVAFFWGPKFLITIHRKEIDFISKTMQEAQGSEACTRNSLLTELLWGVVNSFETPIQSSLAEFETLELEIFRMRDEPGQLETGYFLKRRASVFRRILKLTQEMLYRMQNRDEAENFLPIKALSNQIAHQVFYTDELIENIHNALNLQISLASQKTNLASHQTNEVMRVLTIFSVFLLPLNLIAGIYGMNFHHMPELDWKYGYPMALGAMLLLSILSYLGFKRRGWIR